MGTSERYCAKGERCLLYDPEAGKPQKLSRLNKDDVCGSCRRADAEAEEEARRRAKAVRFWHVKKSENPLKDRVTILKRNLVAQVIARRGAYWDAIKEVRARWQLDPVPTQMPPDSDDILYPPSVSPLRPPRPREYIIAPDVPNPHIGEPGDQKQYEEWLRLRTAWDLGLGDMVSGVVPKRYLGEHSSPYGSWPAHEGLSLAWYRFAAACVLYQPPAEEAARFAEYGGLPFPREDSTGDEPVPDVLTERDLREGTIDLEVRVTMEGKISEKVWELRSELGHLDFRRARQEVRKRHRSEFITEYNRLFREQCEREAELDPPRKHYIAVDLNEISNKGVLNALQEIRKKEEASSRRGRPPHDNLLPVMIAVLLRELGRTAQDLADQLNLSVKRVQALEREGQKLLGPGVSRQ